MSTNPVAVHLYGTLAEEFGAEHHFIIQTPAEAVRALSANYPNFRRRFIETERYHVLADGDWRDGEDGAVLPVSREVHLVPHMEGSAPLGAALVGMAVPALAGTFAAQLIGGLLVTALLWGVSQLFNKPQEADTGDDKSESYIFTGAANTAAQGSAVPVIYGRMFVGSVVVSAGLSVGDQQITSTSQQLLAREQVPLDADDRMRQNNGVPDAPPIVLQNVTTDPNYPMFRLGPDGWRMVGIVSLLDGEQVRTVEVWVPPEAGLPYKWDYIRGFRPYQPGETGLIEP